MLNLVNNVEDSVVFLTDTIKLVQINIKFSLTSAYSHFSTNEKNAFQKQRR